jgi:hypothetical protein
MNLIGQGQNLQTYMCAGGQSWPNSAPAQTLPLFKSAGGPAGGAQQSTMAAQAGSNGSSITNVQDLLKFLYNM